MKLVYSLLLAVFSLWEAAGYPGYYPYYGNNFDTLSYGSSDNTRGGMVLSRYFNPYYNPRAGSAGMAAFMFKPPEDTPQLQHTPSSPYYIPDRRRQTQQEENFFPQQNEVYYPQAPEKPVAITEPTDLAEPTEKVDLIPTTARATIPEIVEPEVEEVEEPVQKPKKRVSKRKQVKAPVEDEEDDEYQPKMPTGAFFPMFFGWGGRGASGGGAPGATAIANAYSTGRGGVATSHATAYGAPRPEFKDYKDYKPQP